MKHMPVTHSTHTSYMVNKTHKTAMLSVIDTQKSHICLIEAHNTVTFSDLKDTQDIDALRHWDTYYMYDKVPLIHTKQLYS